MQDGGKNEFRFLYLFLFVYFLICSCIYRGPKAYSPTHFIEKNWKEEEHSRGCYVGVFGPGGYTSAGSALSAPVGRINFAGTETASRWYGCIYESVRKKSLTNVIA